jgi:tRNA nucleotidyltransferase/poly(A) polymerase
MTGVRSNALFTPERAPWLGAGPLARLLDVLDTGGEEARVVGGAVRNTLLGLAHGDIDVATTALPDEVMRRVASAGFHAVPTGIEHGTITVVVDEVPFEVTTLREDIETDGRHATVRFGRDWKADAERRDFTINALFLRRDGHVIDFVGGLEDIQTRRVRFIGDPRKRIAEDRLRVLRFFRFHAAYGRGEPDGAGLAACIRALDGLELLSRERVRVETIKLLVATRAAETAHVMSDAGILGRVIGGVADLAGLRNMAAIEAALGLAPDPVRRLAAVAVRILEDAVRLRERLRLSNDEYRRLRVMAERWWRIAPDMGEAAACALLYRIGVENFRDRVLLAFARSRAAANDAAWRALAELPARWTAPKFPLAAKDFLARGLEKGPALGAALAAAEEAWVAAGFPGDAAALAAIAKEAVKAGNVEGERGE